MRGKRSTELPERGQTRNIPAYAGKTIRAVQELLGHSEHPRVCGENITRREAMSLPTGTSPRMRGKLHVVRNVELRVRNIPAYAGKTDRYMAAARDH